MKRLTSLVAQDFIGNEINCEDLVQCVYDLNELEFNTYCALLKMNESDFAGYTVNEIQEFIGRKEKTMVNRALKRLFENGLVYREAKTSTSSLKNDSPNDSSSTPKRGYYYVYKPLSLDNLINELKDRLDHWYETALGELGNIKSSFKLKYELDLKADEITTNS